MKKVITSFVAAGVVLALGFSPGISQAESGRINIMGSDTMGILGTSIGIWRRNPPG